MLLAIVTAGMIGTAHMGSAPVFARPTSAPAKPPLASGPPLPAALPPLICYGYAVNVSRDQRDPKDQATVNPELHSQGDWCHRAKPPRT